MASNNSVASSQQQQNQQQQHQQFQQPNSQHHCKECGLFFDSGKSLEVHLQYHKENLLNKWATQASQGTSGGSDETNNNNTKSNNNKREFGSHPNTIAAAADSSDAMLKSSSNKSPESYASRTTPETSTTSFGHPPTPQSYSSAPSPYQTADGANFSPSYQNYPPVKSERASPLNHYPSYQSQQHMYPADPSQYFMDQQHAGHPQSQQQLGYPQDYPVHKIPSQSAGFRYHPYHHGGTGYDRSPQVSSSSPAYPSQNPQPTPSPSPKQCDKCGCVCDSAAQLIDHLNHAHPSTPAAHINNPFTQHPHSQQQHFPFNTIIKTEIKSDDEPQTEILDLDSHKVHQVFQSPEEEESLKRHNGEMANLNGPNPHSVSAMLNSWPNGSPQQKMFSPTATEHRQFFPDQKMFSNGQENKMYQGNMSENKMFQQEQKLFQPHQMHSPEFGSTNGVTTTSQDGGSQGLAQYRSFEHMPPQPTPPVISSTQLPNAVANSSPVVVPSKGANWKSNEARRPKTYNCSACNKWFTSSGHLKRHYNTTLHKNAVKSSGQPDPATMPISAHHHPGREPSSRSSDTHSSTTSPDPMDDPRDDVAVAAFERTQHPGMLQQPPSGPYDRQQPPPPNLHSPMGQSPVAANNPLTSLSAGSPPNGEAGPSVTNQDHSRGLLSISTPNTPQQITPLSPMVASMSTGSNQLGFSLLNQAPHPPHLMGMPSPGPGELNQVGFHQPPPNMSQPSSMPANYPNGLAPHVMQAMATNSQPPVLTSLTTTGEAAFTPELLQYGLQAQQLQYLDQQPLPSFAQFQPHRYGLLLAAGYPHAHQYQANVGGYGPVPAADTAQAQEHHQAFAPAQHAFTSEPRGLIYHDTDGGSYEITVLSNEATNDCILPDLDTSSASSPAPATSPPHLTNHNTQGMFAAAENHSQMQQQQQTVFTKLIKLSPASPIREEIKREYENGSPRITSTGSPLAGKTAPANIHKCFDCDKVFNKACYLTQHNKTCHSGEMPFKCGRCGKRFPNDDAYQEHLAKHAGDKPYKCEQCPKQFNHKTDLRRHMCLHTGQKPYACDHCGKGFIRKDHMLKHADTHSRKTNQAKQHH